MRAMRPPEPYRYDGRSFASLKQPCQTFFATSRIADEPTEGAAAPALPRVSEVPPCLPAFLTVRISPAGGRDQLECPSFRVIYCANIGLSARL